MKQLFFTLLYMALPAAWAVDLELGGQHRARGIYYQQDVEDVFVQRFKLKGAFSPNEMFESHFWMITNMDWGKSEMEGIRVYGYGDWKISDELMIRLGRSPYELGYGSSLSINKYEKYPYALDGAFLTYNTDSMSVDIWGAYLPAVWKGQMEQAAYKETVGLALDIHALEAFKTATLYGMYAMANAEDVKDQIRVGVDLGGEVSDVGYKLSGVAHAEDLKEDVNYAVEGKVYYNTPFDVRFYVGGHYENDTYDPFYHNRHHGAGWLNVAALGGGTVYGKAGASYAPMEHLKLGLTALYFTSIGSWGLWGNEGKELNSESSMLSKEKVLELSLYVKKTFAGGFKAKFSAGAFDVLNSAPYWQVQANVIFNF